MYQHIVKVCLFLILASSNWTFAATTNFDEEITVSKKLAETPLIKGENYQRYKQEDKKLNSEYRSLYQTLSKKNKTLLKNAQRQWLEWRLTKCNAMQEKVNCGTAGCFGVEHDDCIIQMTTDRTSELINFKKSPNNAAAQKFSFSKINETLDD